MAKALVLTGISGSKVGVRQIVSGRVTVVGSAPGCDLVFKDRMVSPRHAEIRQVLDRWFVAPLEPAAQVYINGQTVRSQSRVNAGDTLTLGSVTFTVALGDEAAQAVGSEATPSHNGVPKLGDYLIRRGIVNRAQVQQAVQRQSELYNQGRRLQLGEVLYELGYISRTQLEQAAQDQRNDFYEKFRD